MSELVEPAPPAGTEDGLMAAVQESKQAWHRVGMRLQSTTPALLGRLLLAAGAFVVVAWILGRSVVPLVPFFIGLVLAYVTSPLVEGLDRVLPRGLAVLLVMLGEILFLLLIVAVLVVPLWREFMQLVETLPSTEDLRRFFGDLVAYLRALPEPTQQFIRDGLRQVAVQARDNLAAYVQSVANLGIGAVFGLIRTFSFVVGLLVLPTWIYSVMADQKIARRALDSALPNWARADFWAVVRIVDGTLSASLRGLLLQGSVVGTLTYLGLVLLEQFGLLAIEYKLLAAVLAGLLELVPDIGLFVWAIPAGAIGFSSSTQMGLALLGVYFLSRWLVHRFLVSRFERRVSGDIHPAFMVIAIVALSQFGIVWLFLAAPMVAIAHNLFRYVYGRLREPPRPPGLLPDEPWPVKSAPQVVPARQVARRRYRHSSQGSA